MKREVPSVTCPFLRWLMLSFAIGMVCVSGGCDGYHPMLAALIGFVSGPSYLGISRLKVRLQIDDPVEAVAIHLGGGREAVTNHMNLSKCNSSLPGFLGLMVAPFLRNDGVFYNSEALNMLLFNFVGAVVLIAYYGIISALLFFLFTK